MGIHVHSNQQNMTPIAAIEKLPNPNESKSFVRLMIDDDYLFVSYSASYANYSIYFKSYESLATKIEKEN